MKKIDLGQTVSILANIGVIAGIVFLAFELQQNNRLMAAQARAFESEMSRSYSQDVLQNSDVATAITKHQNGEELTDIEETQVYFLGFRLLRSWQWELGELQAGMLDEATINVTGKRGAYRSNDTGVRTAFERGRGIFRPGFVQWMEENIVNER